MGDSPGELELVDFLLLVEKCLPVYSPCGDVSLPFLVVRSLLKMFRFPDFLLEDELWDGIELCFEERKPENDLDAPIEKDPIDDLSSFSTPLSEDLKFS